MAAKALMPNQHTPLHFIYGIDNCCLCNAQGELKLFKEIAKSDISILIHLLESHGDYPNVVKLLKERYEA
jgi:hypothetical protein